MNAVKVLATILVGLFLIHGVCMARCIAMQISLSSHAEPPCHHRHGSPSGNDSPTSDNKCSDAALEARFFSLTKCCLATATPAVAAVQQESTTYEFLHQIHTQQSQSSYPAVHSLALRI